MLGRLVSGLGYSTDADRLAALRKLKRPIDAEGLEKYLGITNYLRTLVPYYATLT